jgi:hypothetical protein
MGALPVGASSVSDHLSERVAKKSAEYEGESARCVRNKLFTGRDRMEDRRHAEPFSRRFID